MRKATGISNSTYYDEEGLSPLNRSGQIEFDFEYTYYPGSSPVYYYPDGSGDPGCDPEHEIDSVKAISIDGVLLSKEESELVSTWLKNLIDEESIDLTDSINDDLERQYENELECQADYYERLRENYE